MARVDVDVEALLEERGRGDHEPRLLTDHVTDEVGEATVREGDVRAAIVDDDARRFVEPPEPRGEEYCDAATKTHINDDPAQYYDYALAFVIKYQIHDYIAQNLLHQDPRNCNYFGNAQVGAFLKSLLEVGRTVDWRTLIRNKDAEIAGGITYDVYQRDSVTNDEIARRYWLGGKYKIAKNMAVSGRIQNDVNVSYNENVSGRLTFDYDF